MLTMSVEADEESYAVDMRHHSVVVSNVLFYVQLALYMYYTFDLDTTLLKMNFLHTLTVFLVFLNAC